jgi:hypothetical protein
MHVVTLLPWSALLIAGAVQAVAGWAGSVRRAWRVGAAGAVALAVLTGAAVTWPDRLTPMMTTREVPAMRAAQLWVADNVPRDKVLVVHDSIWVDLVHRYRFAPRPIIVSKLDTDPAVQERLTRIDYLVVPEWYLANPAAGTAYPTLVEARKHAVAVASFGDGSDGVRVYRVSRHWSP